MALGLGSHRFQGCLEWRVPITLYNAPPSRQSDDHCISSKSSSTLPKNSVAGGVTAEGEVTYVARVTDLGYWTANVVCGGYIPSKKKTSIPSGLGEDMMDLCDILVCHDPEILHWVDCSLGNVPDNAITINTDAECDKRDLTFIARTRPGIDGLINLKNVTRPHYKITQLNVEDFEGPILGGIEPRVNKMHFAFNGLEYSVANYQVLCAYLPPPIKHLSIDSPYTWVPASDGYIPENGLIGGKTEEGEDVYVAGVDTMEGFDIGYVVPSEKVCHYFDHERLMSSSLYEVLVPSDPSHFHWSTEHNHGTIFHVKNKIKCMIGRTKPGFKGQADYSSRVEREYPDHVQVVGSWTNLNEQLKISYKNEMMYFDEYESLVVDKVPNSLQEFCRYVILESTSGVPHRINRLPLPQKMKDYCQLRSDEMHHTVQLD